MAFYNRGHIDHQDHRDIYPAGSVNGQSWPAQGTTVQLDLLKAGSCPAPAQDVDHVQVAAPSAGAPTCNAAGRLVIPLTEHVTWKGGADGDGPGTYRLRAKADPGYVIDGQRKWTITVEPQLTGAQCAQVPDVVTPLAPSWVDPCGAANGHWVFTATADYDYTVTTNNDGSTTITAVAKGNVQFVAGATTQWTERDSGAPCPRLLDLPAQPRVNDPCGADNATWVVPAKGGNLTWTLLRGGNLEVSTDAGYTFPNGKSSHNFGQAPETNKDACPVVLASVAVATPVLTPPTCTAAGVLTYSDHLGYTWRRTDDHGNVVLTAIAKPGFTLTGQTSWTYTAAQLAKLSGDKACPPAVIPPKVEGVKHTAPPKVPVVSPVVEGVKHEAAKNLPRTGSESGLYGAAGLLLLMVGSGLVLATRQRSNEGRAH
jgi:LPXTG-motif cell wall-anchored protein